MSVGPGTEVEGRGEGIKESFGAHSPHEGPPPIECGGREGRAHWDYVAIASSLALKLHRCTLVGLMRDL